MRVLIFSMVMACIWTLAVTAQVDRPESMTADESLRLVQPDAVRPIASQDTDADVIELSELFASPFSDVDSTTQSVGSGVEYSEIEDSASGSRLSTSERVDACFLLCPFLGHVWNLFPLSIVTRLGNELRAAMPTTS